MLQSVPTKVEDLDVLYQSNSFIVDKGQQPLRIDKWLKIRVEGITRNKIQQNIDAGFLTVNGKKVKSNYRIKPNDEIILLSLYNQELSEIKLEKMDLHIEFEDDYLMIINKPANMVVHPGVGNHSGTLLNGIAYYLHSNNPNLTDENLPRFGLVHRIDKNTTGLLVVAKTAASASNLANQFFNHSIKRKYIALVWGNVENNEGTIKTNIARHKNFRKVFDNYPFEGEVGKHAITHYKVLERFNYTTLIECTLETGRTHQIRVHLKHIGHTLFNDIEYGGDKILKGTIYNKYKQFVENCFELCNRCALHAISVGFVHPITNNDMFFESNLPKDMIDVIEKWRGYINNK